MLELSWPHGTKPSELSNFESEARRLRYQALGQACRESGIDSLFLAHHEDDQAETVLQRLAGGHKGGGLQGIKPCGDIPECFGMHGVHQSGLLDNDTTTPSSPWAGETEAPVKPMRLAFEDGGVMVYRPLLPFSKARLQGTCIDEGTSWFEDLTNQDPTATKRNTVRQLLAHARLPSALQKPSLLAIASSTRKRVEESERLAKRLFAACDVQSFDPRVGSIVVRLPPVSLLTDLPVRQRRDAAATLVRQLVDLVSPTAGASRSRLHTAIAALYPSLLHSSDSSTPSASPSEPPPAFTIAGVQFSCVDTADYDNRTWYLHRQPHDSDVFPVLEIPAESAAIGSASAGSPRDLQSAREDPFRLYDGRFWIRVHKPATASFIIRPFRPEDAKYFRAALGSGLARGRLDGLLRRAAPGKVRWTIPALVRVVKGGVDVDEEPEDGGGETQRKGVEAEDDEEENEDQTIEQVVALPTLGVIARRHLPEDMRDVSWEVRYKKVALDRRVGTRGRTRFSGDGLSIRRV